MNRIYKCFFILLCILIITSCSDKEKIEINNNLNEVVNKVKILINDKEYQINLESNKTVEYFINLLPIHIEMSELNGNEKYAYLDKEFPINPTNPKYIESGDVMMYGNNCLVIFYKSFNTSYNYTKIGHIDNLPDLGNDKVDVKIDLF